MDVFLLPSLYEGLPVVGIEAQTSGLLCVFSTSMTKESKILDSTIFLSLKQKELSWAETISKVNHKYNRSNAFNEVSKKGFNIKVEAKKLERFYMKVGRVDEN